MINKNGGVLFFVLNGLMDGEDGHYAVPIGGGPDERLPDGWYWMPDEVGETPCGPYGSRDEAIKDTHPLNLLGHLFTRITEEEATHLEFEFESDRVWKKVLPDGSTLYVEPSTGILKHVNEREELATIWKTAGIEVDR